MSLGSIVAEFEEIRKEVEQYAEVVRSERIKRILKILNNKQDKNLRLQKISNRLSNLLTAMSVIADELNDALEEAEILLDLK